MGIAITALSVVIMPFFSLLERRAGRELGSATAVADSKQTLICTYLSAAVLIGLVLNSLFGWWWADAVAGLVIAVFAVREGIEAWRGDACATSGACSSTRQTTNSIAITTTGSTIRTRRDERHGRPMIRL